jgi:hypothetical protein
LASGYAELPSEVLSAARLSKPFDQPQLTAAIRQALAIKAA